jgi:hypothetical protein
MEAYTLMKMTIAELLLDQVLAGPGPGPGPPPGRPGASESDRRPSHWPRHREGGSD